MKIRLLIFSFFVFSLSFSQTGINTPWTWIAGDKTTFQAGIYGTQGIPSISNKPGGRQYGVTWTDAGGNLWLFGGWLSGGNIKNDLWKYNPTTNEWAWMKGSSSSNQFGIYGTQGITSLTNMPGARSVSTGWIDNSGNLWLFGGLGYGETGYGRLSDLWKYNPTTNEWTWLKGSKAVDNIPVYGTQGTSSPLNQPGGIYAGIGWKDGSGNLWLFGGNGNTAINFSGSINQLWKYNPLTNEWTWVNGAATVNPKGVYGTQGVSSGLNNPGAREAAFRWIDNTGILWLFGGYGYSSISTTLEELNDLWKYNPSTNEWVWVNGDTLGNKSSVYGIQGIPDALNKPGGRDAGASWNDVMGNFWLFGGIYGLNDTWKYDVTTNIWTWIKGDSIANQNGIYGTIGVSQVTNKPGGRHAVMYWTDNSNNFWLFGGSGYAETGSIGNLNDLWKISADALLPVTLVEFNGVVIDNKILLKWKTASEINTAGFIVERSSDGRNFNEVGFTKATGSSSVTKEYFFTDKDPLQESNFYRLKIIDKDGRFTYSNIIKTKLMKSELSFSIYPNPIKDVICLQTKGIIGDATIQLIDVFGKKVKEFFLPLNNNSNTFSIRVADVANGTYLLLIKTASSTLHETVIKF